MTDLSARLREALRQGRRAAPSALASATGTPDIARVAMQVGGRPLDTERGPCVIVERCYPHTGRHGRDRVGDYRVDDAAVVRLLRGEDGADAAPGSAPEARRSAGLPRLVYVDLETTGLSGGAGTVAFLVGCGFFGPDGFVTRQFFLPSLAHERPMLAAAAGCLAEADTVISFNGRSFDVPMMENRWAFHRMSDTLDGTPHLDMLHTSRRLWRRPGRRSPQPPSPWRDDAERAHASRCTLGVLEHEMLGVKRVGDPDGFEIPSLYFDYVRCGDASGLEPVLEHNRLDLISLAGLTSRAATLVRLGPEAAVTSTECLGLGRIYERSGRQEVALRCFARAAGLDWPIVRTAADRQTGHPLDVAEEPEVRADALRRLARALRRARRFEEAAHVWQRLAESAGASTTVCVEALEALAVHHEHRTRNLDVARRLASQALAGRREPRLQETLRYRLARLERKLGRSTALAPLPLEGPPAARR